VSGGLPMALSVSLPDWVPEVLARVPSGADDETRMRLAISLARENVDRDLGGPFAAVAYREDTGTPVSVGLNRVLPLTNSVLHAEVVAIMLAESALGVHRFSVAGCPAVTVVATCEPCAMCLGALLWSAPRRLVCGARKQDAEAAGFDEGPVGPEAWEHLARVGIEVIRGVCREEASAVLRRYVAAGGVRY